MSHSPNAKQSYFTLPVTPRDMRVKREPDEDRPLPDLYTPPVRNNKLETRSRVCLVTDESLDDWLAQCINLDLENLPKLKLLNLPAETKLHL